MLFLRPARPDHRVGFDHVAQRNLLRQFKLTSVREALDELLLKGRRNRLGLHGLGVKLPPSLFAPHLAAPIPRLQAAIAKALLVLFDISAVLLRRRGGIRTRSRRWNGRSSLRGKRRQGSSRFVVVIGTAAAIVIVIRVVLPPIGFIQRPVQKVFCAIQGKGEDNNITVRKGGNTLVRRRLLSFKSFTRLSWLGV